MRIGELARRSGVSVRALRYYEEHGLLTAERTAGGQRVYRDASVDRVRLIQQLYAAGLPSRTVAGLLPCVYSPETVTADEILGRLTDQRDEIDHKITDLQATRDRLDTVITQSRNHFGTAVRQP